MTALELAEALEHHWPCSSQQPHQAAAMLRKQSNRIEQLETALSECRDSITPPAPGAATEQAWSEACNSALSVPAYVKQALEAALKPGEPVATLWQHAETGKTRVVMNGAITDCDASWLKATDLVAAPPAQTPQVSGVMKVDEVTTPSGVWGVLPNPVKAPPPRLSMHELHDAYNYASDGHTTGLRAIETAVRAQFGVNDE